MSAAGSGSFGSPYSPYRSQFDAAAFGNGRSNGSGGAGLHAARHVAGAAGRPATRWYDSPSSGTYGKAQPAWSGSGAPHADSASAAASPASMSDELQALQDMHAQLAVASSSAVELRRAEERAVRSRISQLGLEEDVLRDRVTAAGKEAAVAEGAAREARAEAAREQATVAALSAQVAALRRERDELEEEAHALSASQAVLLDEVTRLRTEREEASSALAGTRAALATAKAALAQESAGVADQRSLARRLKGHTDAVHRVQRRGSPGRGPRSPRSPRSPRHAAASGGGGGGGGARGSQRRSHAAAAASAATAASREELSRVVSVMRLQSVVRRRLMLLAKQRAAANVARFQVRLQRAQAEAEAAQAREAAARATVLELQGQLDAARAHPSPSYSSPDGPRSPAGFTAGGSAFVSDSDDDDAAGGGVSDASRSVASGGGGSSRGGRSKMSGASKRMSASVRGLARVMMGRGKGKRKDKLRPSSLDDALRHQPLVIRSSNSRKTSFDEVRWVESYNKAWEDVGAWERLSGNVPPACLAPGPQQAALVRQRYVRAAMARQLQTQSAAQAFIHAATPNH